MQNLIWIALLAVTLSGCAEVPGEIVLYSKTLESHADELGKAHLATVQAYHDRLASVNDHYFEAASSVLTEYESDLSLLVTRHQQLAEAYEVLASEMKAILDADGQDMFDSVLDTATRQSIHDTMIRERIFADLVNKDLAPIVNQLENDDFAAYRSSVKELHDGINRRNDEAAQTLNFLVTDEFEVFSKASAALTAFLESLVAIEEQRGRLLGDVESKIRELQESDVVSRGGAIFDVLKDLTETLVENGS